LVLLVSGQTLADPIEADLNDYFNFSTCTNLVSSSSGKVAWVELLAGVPNIFLFDPKFFGTTQLTNYMLDQGLEITNLCFASDEERIFYSLTPIEGANSASLRDPIVGHIVVVGLQLSPTEITLDGSTFLTCNDSIVTVLSPDGQLISNIRVQKNGISDPPIPIVKLQSGNYQGYIGSAVWNADGTCLAFDNNRGDHGFVGVACVKDASVKWLASTFHFNQNPVWSPNGKHVAFYQLRPITDKRGVSMKTAFKVVIVEVATGNAVTIFSDKDFGFPQSDRYGQRPLLWPTGDTIVFSSQSSGWLHVYSANVNTLKVQDLSPGQHCEVQSYVGSQDGSSIFVAHNCDEIDSMGIAQIDLIKGYKLADIVVGRLGVVAGLTDSGFSMVPSGADGFAFMFSTHNESTSVMFTTNPKATPKQISGSHNSPTSQNWTQPSLATFPSLDSRFTLHAQFFFPRDFSLQKTYPALVFTHGGPMRQMYPAIHYSSTYAQFYALNQYFASKDYVVLSINYRMGIGYGYDFEYCSTCGELGAQEYLDVKAGALWLQNHTTIKIGKIGIYGLSYGGLNTLQALARDSNLFAAGVASAPVFNWISASRSNNDPRFQYMPLMSYVSLGIGPEPNLATTSWSEMVDQNIKLAYESSPAGHLKTWKSPTMVIHGDSDHSVEVQESIGLVYALEDKGDVVVESLMVPNESHGMGSYANQVRISVATAKFLAKYIPTQQ